MARYGRMLGYQAESDYFSAQADTTLAAVNRTYLKDGNYSNATVTANLLPLAMNLVPKEQEAEVRKNLLTTIIDKTIRICRQESSASSGSCAISPASESQM